MILASAFPGRAVLTKQEHGQCSACGGKVWRLLLDGARPGETRQWVAVEVGYPGVVHYCVPPRAA